MGLPGRASAAARARSTTAPETRGTAKGRGGNGGREKLLFVNGG